MSVIYIYKIVVAGCACDLRYFSSRTIMCSFIVKCHEAVHSLKQCFELLDVLLLLLTVCD